MKPEGAKELRVSSDLTIASCENALELLGIKCRDFTNRMPDRHGIVIISVASQQVGHAKMVADRLWLPPKLAAAIDIDFGYAPDEWSVMLETYPELKVVREIVWSPGA